jgi:hypothetical protein
MSDIQHSSAQSSKMVSRAAWVVSPSWFSRAPAHANSSERKDPSAVYIFTREASGGFRPRAAGAVPHSRSAREQPLGGRRHHQRSPRARHRLDRTGSGTSRARRRLLLPAVRRRLAETQRSTQRTRSDTGCRDQGDGESLGSAVAGQRLRRALRGSHRRRWILRARRSRRVVHRRAALEEPADPVNPGQRRRGGTQWHTLAGMRVADSRG